jgi:aminoglycoside 6-adenylyltransferase
MFGSELAYDERSFMHPKYSGTTDMLRTWSQREKAIQGAIILGSQVRQEFEGDEWSDLDVLLLVDNPDVFMQTDTWLARFGEVVCVTVEETILGWVQLTWSIKRVLLADHRAIDFSILPYDRVDDVLSINAEIHVHGYQVIYDAFPDVITSKIKASLATVKEASLKLPTEAEVRRAVDDMLFHLIWACKKNQTERVVGGGSVHQSADQRSAP